MNIPVISKFESLYFLPYVFVAIWNDLDVFYNNFVQGFLHMWYGQIGDSSATRYKHPNNLWIWESLLPLLYLYRHLKEFKCILDNVVQGVLTHGHIWSIQFGADLSGEWWQGIVKTKCHCDPHWAIVKLNLDSRENHGWQSVGQIWWPDQFPTEISGTGSCSDLEIYSSTRTQFRFNL